MKHFYKLLFTAFLCPIFSYAQSNYKPGYVIILKGDTIHGFIDYKEWDSNPAQINFKTNLQNKEAEKYSAKNISAFSITGFEYYEQYKLSISKDQVEVGKLSTGIDTGTFVSNVFLRTLVKGKNVNLYEYRDDIKTRFYIKEQQSAWPEELIYRSYFNPNEDNQIISQTLYRNQLQGLAIKYVQNSEKLINKIEKIGYSETDLITIVNNINGEQKPGNKEFKRNAVRLYAGIAVDRNSLKYSGRTALAMDPINAYSYGPKINFGMDVFTNSNVGHFIFRLESSFATTNLHTSSNAYPYASQSFKQFTSSLTPQIIYNVYNTDFLKLFVGVGASFNFSKNSNVVNSHTDYYTWIRPMDPKNYPMLASTWASFIGKAGLVVNKRYELYIGYAPPASVTDHYAEFSGDVTSMQLGINFLFGKTH